MGISRIMSWSMRRSSRRSSLSQSMVTIGTEDATPLVDLYPYIAILMCVINRGDGLDGRRVALQY